MNRPPPPVLHTCFRGLQVEAELVVRREREAALHNDIDTANALIHDFRTQMFGAGWDDLGDEPKFGIFKRELVVRGRVCVSILLCVLQ
jgi:hypothetical protein